MVPLKFFFLVQINPFWTSTKIGIGLYLLHKIKIHARMRFENAFQGKDTPQKMMFFEKDLNREPPERQTEILKSSMKDFFFKKSV